MVQRRGITLASAIATAGAFLFGFSSTASAQNVIEEVVVTAQKREESLSDVPVAVSVLGQQQIDAAFVRAHHTALRYPQIRAPAPQKIDGVMSVAAVRNRSVSPAAGPLGSDAPTISRPGPAA